MILYYGAQLGLLAMIILPIKLTICGVPSAMDIEMSIIKDT